jgi:hypothetical protein
MADLIKGEPVAITNALTSMTTTIVGAVLLAWVAIMLYKRERILG